MRRKNPIPALLSRLKMNKKTPCLEVSFFFFSFFFYYSYVHTRLGLFRGKFFISILYDSFEGNKLEDASSILNS
jgi:hypothetical protein